MNAIWNVINFEEAQSLPRHCPKLHALKKIALYLVEEKTTNTNTDVKERGKKKVLHTVITFCCIKFNHDPFYVVKSRSMKDSDGLDWYGMVVFTARPPVISSIAPSKTWATNKP